MKQNKKRIFSLMTALAMLVTLLSGMTVGAASYSGGDGTQQNPYILSTPDDLVAFHTAISNDDGSLDKADECGLGMYHGYYFELGADIDMTGVAWTPVSFCGHLDGNGYTIKNLSVTEAANDSGEYWAGMFAQLINATVSDITFQNCSASISEETSSTRDVYAAIVAANAIASKLEQIKVVDCTVTQNGYAKNIGYAAFVAAIADITNITGCVVTDSLISVNTPSTNPMNVGGITGCFEDMFYEYIADYGNPFNMAIGAGSDYGIYDCYVSATLNVTAGRASHVAGIAGMTCTDFLDVLSERNGVAAEIKNCVVEGTIQAADNDASGITGWDESGDCIIDCVNMAALTAPTTFPLGELPETVINSYYLAQASDEQGGRTAAQFDTGEVCIDRGRHFGIDGKCAICGVTIEEYTLTFEDILNSAWFESGTYRIGNGAAAALSSEGVTVMNKMKLTLTLTAKTGYIVKSITYNDAEYPVTNGVVTITPSVSGAVTATAEERQPQKPYFETVTNYVNIGTYQNKPSFVTYAKINPGYGYDDKVSEFGFTMKTAEGQEIPMKTKEAAFPSVLQYGIRAFGDLESGETYEMIPYLIVEEEKVTGTTIPVKME